MSSSAPKILSLEARLSSLEARVGRNSTSSTDDIPTRLQSLQAALHSHTTPVWRQQIQESLRLLEELHPGPALTHQQQPLLYKRQDVLANAERLQHDFQLMQQIPLPLPEIAVVPPAEQQRLQVVQLSLQDTARRLARLQEELDRLLESYHVAMTAASEKMLLAQEALQQR